MTAPVPVRDYDPLRDKSYRETALGPAVVDFLAWKRLGGLSERSAEDYEWALAKGCKMYPTRPLEAWTDAEVLHVLATFPQAGRRERAVAYRELFKWARLTRRIKENPMELVPKIKRRPQKVIDVFTDAERVALEGLPLRDGALMRVLFSAGLRKGEARRLRYRDVRPEPLPGQLVILNGKGGKDRLVPIGDKTARMIAELALTEGLESKDHLWYSSAGNNRSGQIRRRWFNANGVEQDQGETVFVRWWQRCLKEAGVRYRNPHVTRHTFATNWLRRGGRLEVLSKVMGHSSIAITSDLYGHLDTRDAEAELALIESEE